MTWNRKDIAVVLEASSTAVYIKQTNKTQYERSEMEQDSLKAHKEKW